MLAELVIAHDERAVVRIGDAYVKADVNTARLDREVSALRSVEVPRPEVLWHRRGPVSLLALSEVSGVPLASLGAPSPHREAVWAMAGEVARRVHDEQVPESLAAPSEYRSEDLDRLEDWLLSRRLADPQLISEHVDRARAVRNSATNDCLIHGDFQPAHVLVDEGQIRGVIDWGDAGTGDPLYDLAVLTVGHSEYLEAVVGGYGGSVDRDRINGYWSWRRLGSIRWMIEHGFDATDDIEGLTVLGS